MCSDVSKSFPFLTILYDRHFKKIMQLQISFAVYIWFVSLFSENSVVQSILKIYMIASGEFFPEVWEKDIKINHHLYNILTACNNMALLIWHLAKVVHML